MTLMSSISKLTGSVDQLAAEANVTKVQLDAQVAQAEAEVISAQAEQTATEAVRDESAAHAADAATHLATVKANVTYEGIGAILAEKAVTAVDIFVYDTSLDSDGGAWRKRCQHTSWYNEPLNTATCGARREFPAVAVIVAEENRLTIYDGDDPALPMWMVFDNDFDTDMIYGGATSTLTSIVMHNAVLVIGASPYALNVVSFLAETGRYLNTSSLGSHLYKGTISERNDNKNIVQDAYYGPILNNRVNDVAITVLPDAPVDPATGLPIPTIAAATSGGTSVIRDNGAVIDILNWGSNRTMRVAFDADGRLFIHDAHYSVNGYGAVVQFNALPDENASALLNNHAAGDALYDVGINGWNLPRTNDSNVHGFSTLLANDGTLACGSYTTGLATLYYTDSDNDGLASFHGWDHAPYFAPRNTKAVFLAETDKTDLVTSAELNDDADMIDSSLWSYSADGVDWSILGQVTITEQNGSDRSLNRNLPGIKDNKYYRVEIQYNNSTTSASGNRIQFAGRVYYVLGAVSEPTTQVFYAKAMPGFQNIGILLSQTNATTTILRMSVKEVDFDRHQNPLASGGGPGGLIVNGTITRIPVAAGAELVAYSGFRSVSGSEKYLVQPYNSGLNFGTGDFSVMFWVFDPGGHSTTAVLQRKGMGGADTGLYIWRFTSTSSRALVLTVGNNGISAAQATPIGVWTHVTMMRRNSELSVYLDGKLSAGGIANAYDVISDQPMYFGVSADIGGGNEAMRYALWRISDTAPVPDQIAKIYEEERKLFMPGAQCTLYGTSDAVTALARDPKTNLLHVGTSQGRSVFDGLVRVANTENPVTTAISAVGGMIAEQ